MLDIEWYPLEKITQTTGDLHSFTGVYMVYIQGIYIFIYTRYIYIYIYKVYIYIYIYRYNSRKCLL